LQDILPSEHAMALRQSGLGLRHITKFVLNA
jgi:hypothetical protein